jgi:flagellum-specific peptidoglycan hydrolase FlgJ
MANTGVRQKQLLSALKGDGTAKKTQEFINGQWMTITDSFIDFPDLLSCVIYLVDHWYKDYKNVQRLQ